MGLGLSGYEDTCSCFEVRLELVMVACIMATSDRCSRLRLRYPHRKTHRSATLQKSRSKEVAKVEKVEVQCKISFFKP